MLGVELILVPEGVSDRSQKETALQDGNEKEEAIGKDTAGDKSQMRTEMGWRSDRKNAEKSAR